MCCREEPVSSPDDDLIPTSLEIGTKPLDLEGLGRIQLSALKTSLRTDKFPPARCGARTNPELQALIDLQWSKAPLRRHHLSSPFQASRDHPQENGSKSRSRPHSQPTMAQFNANALRNIYRLAIPAAIGVSLASQSIYDVRGGSRAVIFDRLSGVREGVISEGTHFLVPWLQKSIIFDVRTKPRMIATTTGSKDLQMVSLTLRVLHRPEVQALPKIYQVCPSSLLPRAWEEETDC